MRTGTAQLGPARLADCPASESDSAGHSAAAFERTSSPGRPPVPINTYRLGLTLINGIERPGPTRPRGIAWPNLSMAAAVASGPQHRRYMYTRAGRASPWLLCRCRIVSPAPPERK